MIDCIIIDDTPLAVEKLEKFISQLPFLHLQRTFNNAMEAIVFIRTHPVNLVFLDIQMEEFTGLQFLEALHIRPQIIIVSAYGEYAVQGFEHDVTDYLLKPYSFERFLKAVDKASINLQQEEKPSRNYTFLKTEYRMVRVNFDDILYIESVGAYLHVITRASKIMTLLNFKQMEAILPPDNFIRTHKSFIAAIDKIENIERDVLKIGDKRIPLSKSYRKEFYLKLQ